MPLYDYRCAQCGKVTEVRHGFDEAFDSPCPACGGAMTRVFNPAPIVFKGSGFYVTDSRKTSASKDSKPAETSSPQPAEAKSDTKAAPAEKKADAKPADSAA